MDINANGTTEITITEGLKKNTFSLTFQMIIGGFGAVISTLLIIGIFFMFYNGQMQLQTFIKCLMIAVIMFLIAGMVVYPAL